MMLTQKGLEFDVKKELVSGQKVAHNPIPQGEMERHKAVGVR